MKYIYAKDIVGSDTLVRRMLMLIREINAPQRNRFTPPTIFIEATENDFLFSKIYGPKGL